MSNAITVLYVDDETVNNILFKASFRLDFNVLVAESAESALRILATQKVDVIISDQRMPEMPGTELLKTVLDLYPNIVRILISGYSDIKSITEAFNVAKVSYFVSKPWKEEEIVEVVKANYAAAQVE